MSPTWAILFFCGVTFLASRFVCESRKRSQKYFPGPPSEPLLGHLRAFPHDTPWMKLSEWGKVYGGQALKSDDNSYLSDHS